VNAAAFTAVQLRQGYALAARSGQLWSGLGLDTLLASDRTPATIRRLALDLLTPAMFPGDQVLSPSLTAGVLTHVRPHEHLSWRVEPDGTATLTVREQPGDEALLYEDGLSASCTTTGDVTLLTAPEACHYGRRHLLLLSSVLTAISSPGKAAVAFVPLNRAIEQFGAEEQARWKAEWTEAAQA